MTKTYLAMYEDRTVAISGGADLTVYRAKLQAIAELQQGQRRKVKGHMVSIMLAELDSQPVVHAPL